LVFRLLLFELFTIDDDDRDASNADVDEDDDDADDDGFDVELGDDEEDEDAVAAVVVVEYGVDKELKKLHSYLGDQQYSIWDSYQNII